MRIMRMLSGLMMVAMVTVAGAQTVAPATADARLPVRRVVLFKNGVGYFEHSGRVRESQQVNINFTSSQLNDVLKSLTVLDLGKGRITGVSYNSTAPIEQRLQALRLPVAKDSSQAGLLLALRGARVEVHSGAVAVTGRLLSVETREIKRKDDSTTSIDTIAVITDGGEIRNFELGPAVSVRVLERDLNEEIGRYLNVVASARDQDVRRMTIGTAGSGERELFVSYISEVPVWKSTYRIVLPEKADVKPILQGWAIVDNTVGEDWKDVQLSLVTGAPQSFIEQLSTPYYARRPVVALPQTAMLTPQTHEQTLEASEQEPAPPPPPPPPAGVPMSRVAPAPASAGVIGGIIGGVGAGYGGGIGGGVYKSWLKEDVAAIAEAQESAAKAHDLGDLFEYRLEEPVTIRKNQSALVPIVQARVDAEKVTLWSAASRPLRALWLTNSSGLTLDGGSFNILESSTFAGEGLMDPMKPGEKRLLSYAVDLGVVIDGKRDSQRQRISRVRISHGVLTQTTEMREQNTYTLRNQDTTARTVVIEHPVRNGMKFAHNSPTPAESTTSFHRFRVNVEPKTTATLKVEEFRPTEVSYQLTNLTDDLVAMFVRERTINAEMEKALRRILAQKSGIATLDAQMQLREKDMSAIFEDQQRVRENLKALKGSAEEKELTQRYTRQLNQQEDRVQTLRNEIGDLRGKRALAKQDLDRTIEDLSLEVTL